MWSRPLEEFRGMVSPDLNSPERRRFTPVYETRVYMTAAEQDAASNRVGRTISLTSAVRKVD